MDNETKTGAQSPLPKNEGLSFTTPTKIIDLPSEGIYYPNGEPSEVTMRYPTAKEQEILYNKSNIRKGTALDLAIKRCIKELPIPYENLLVGDKDALAVEFRTMMYGEEHKAKVKCPECGAMDEDFYFNTGNYEASRVDQEFLEHEGIEVKVKEDGTKTFVVVTPISQLKVEFRLLTVKDQMFVMKTQAQYRKKNINVGLIEMQLKKMIVSVNGSRRVEDIDKFCTEFPARDINEVMNASKLATPSVDLRQKFECRSCGYDGKVSVPLDAKFFWSS